MSQKCFEHPGEAQGCRLHHALSHRAISCPSQHRTLQVGASASLLKTSLIGLVLSWKMHEKTAFPCPFFGSKVIFTLNKAFFGLFSVVICASRTLPTYQSPSEPLGSIANLLYYVFKCTLAVEFYGFFFIIFEAKLHPLKYLALFYFNGSPPHLSQGITWSSHCLKLDAVIRASLSHRSAPQRTAQRRGWKLELGVFMHSECDFLGLCTCLSTLQVIWKWMSAGRW